MPKVSVVMPVYNGEKYLREAIDSIIDQTFTDWEFIIVNEYGSNQTATDILKEYAARDSRIKVIQNTERLGIAESLNVGIRAAAGKYIARMDGDDVSMPNRLQLQVEYMDSNPEIDLCGTFISDLSGNKLDWNLETDCNQIDTDIIFFSPCVHPTIMFRASLVRERNIKYDPSYMASEDYDFFEKVCRVGKIANLPHILLHYRLHTDNATEKNSAAGANLYRQVMRRVLTRLKLSFSEKELSLLSPHECMKKAQGKEVLSRLIKLDQLLKKILLANKKTDTFSRKTLSHTLYKRMLDAKNSISWACQNINWQEIDNFYNNSMFKHPYFVTTEQGEKSKKEPLISVVLPTYNSEAYIADTLDSILRQTFTNFEVLIINEYGSQDVTLDFIDLFSDCRIKVFQNKQRLGLAESLNLGMREARGKYIARIDADDTCVPDRFAKQIEFLDKHPDYGLCGSWQHHFGIGTDMIHKVPTTHEALQAQLLYRCELCHSTLMLRRSSFISNNLFYNAKCAAEDYELWTRAVYQMKFANLPEVLGEYRISETNITAQKIERLSKESANICTELLRKYLEINVLPEHVPFLSSWINEFNKVKNPYTLRKHLAIEKDLLCKMWNRNKRLKIYNQAELLYVINKRWRWVTNNWTFGTSLGEIFELKALFEKYPMPDSALKSSLYIVRSYLYKAGKKIFKKLFRPVYQPIQNRLNARFSKLQCQIWDVEGHIKDHQVKMLNDIKKWHDKRISEVLSCFYDKITENLIAELRDTIYSHALEIKREINQSIDARIWKAEQALTESIDARIWKAEQALTESTDARIWKAEQALTESTDAQIWKAEQALTESTDARIWKAEQALTASTDARIWKGECVLRDEIERHDQSKQILEETHRHIDFTYRDLMVALQQQQGFLPKNEIRLETDFPIARESLDHLYPHGTIRDNTRYPRFVEKCETLLAPKTNLAFLDLGCSGGGMVLEAALRGHISMGLEGSDCSKKEQRAEWRLLGDQLQTCDITKPFYLRKTTGEVQLFDIITAWEVLEHIFEDDLPQLFENIRNHLMPGGYFVGSIANWDDIDPESGVNWHVTVHPYDWWKQKFEKSGFVVCTEVFDTIDLARGAYNPPQCYLKPAETVCTETSFHIAVKKEI